MVALTNILSNYFGIVKMFNENGEPTIAAQRAAGKLLDLLYDCDDMGLCKVPEDVEEQLELIIGVPV